MNDSRDLSDNATGSYPEGSPINAHNHLLQPQPLGGSHVDIRGNVLPDQFGARLHPKPVEALDTRQHQPNDNVSKGTLPVSVKPQHVNIPSGAPDMARTQPGPKSDGGSSPPSSPDAHPKDCDAVSLETNHRQPPHIKHKYWTTNWLRRRALVSLAALFAVLAGSLIVVWRMNKSRNGFRTTLSSNHYAWTYGPTAILVVVLGFWRQVDFYCKVMQPWRTMSSGAQDANRTVLLNYVSPINATSLFRAVQYRHGHVAASIIGFMILKLVILFSTGLLVLTPTSVSTIHDITTTEVFDSNMFQEATLGDGIIPMGSSAVRAYTNISARPVYEYFKILEEQSLNPSSEIDNYVLPSITPASGSTVSSVLAKLDVFVPHIECEMADAVLRPSDIIQYKNQATGAGTETFVRLESATCSVGAENQSSLSVNLRPGSTSCAAYDDPCETWVSYNLWRVNCSDVVDPQRYAGRKVGDLQNGTQLNMDTIYDFRFAVLVSNLTFDDVQVASRFDRPAQAAVQHETAAMICKMNYSMNAATVLHDFADDSITVQELTPVDPLDGFSGTMLGEAMHSALYASQGLSLDGVDTQSDPNAESPFYRLMLQTLPEPRTMDQFLSADVLHDSVMQVWAGLSTQFVRDNFLKPSHMNKAAMAVVVEERLYVELISLWIMVIGFLLVLVLTLCMVFSKAAKAVPQDPRLISTAALVLSASPSLQKLLHDCGDMRTSQITRSLSGFRFGTSTEGQFCITATQNDSPEKEAAEVKTKAGTWMPLAAKYPMLCLTLTLPLAAIAVLEVLYRISERNDGFVDVSGSETTATYLSRYISALTVLIIATCFNALDFTISSFAPYTRLRSGSAPAGESIRMRFLGQLPPVALFWSIANKQFAPAFSNLAGTTGSVLTIVASGLWVINRAVITETPVSASLSDRWEVNWPSDSASGDSGAALVFDHFQHGSATIPPSIWNDLVIPSISNIRSSSEGTPMADLAAPLTSNYTFEVDSIRPLLSCQVVSEDDFEINTLHSTGTSRGAGPLTSYEQIYVSAYPPLPQGCQHGGPYGIENHFNFSSGIFVPNGTDDTTSLGNFDDLHLGPWSLAMGSPYRSMVQEYGENAYNIGLLPDNPAGCPSVGVTFARLSANGSSKDDVTVLVCSQKLQQVKTRLTYEDDEAGTPTIRPDVAPVLVDEPPRFLTNGTDGIEDYPYRVQKFLHGNNGSLTTFSTTGDSLNPSLDPPLDLFMNHLVYGPNGTAVEDLLGKANQETLIKAVQELYAKYMRIVIDTHFRTLIPLDARAETLGDDGLLQGTLYTTTSRLQVNYASKLALQIMLGVMTVLGACAFLMTDLRGTLPRAPYSIASTMAFLAGSDLCDEQKSLLPRDAQWMSGKELDRVFDGWRFSLGWWPGVAKGKESRFENAKTGEENIVERKDQLLEGGRFGIDVDAPKHLGFRETKVWALRRRLTTPSAGAQEAKSAK